MIEQSELDKAYKLYYNLCEFYDETLLQSPEYYINNIENMKILILAYDKMNKDFEYLVVIDSPIGWYMACIANIGRKYTV
ncbi:Hypothetical protein PACV_94 [Pacmanvirus A23]|uniref:Hypothetical protein n=1 Tax=Pacmanvirus A23 TaxID=1932881 RepID=UPI000A092AE2|nr:Hypothetical protein B9W72_gp094 [Pacmanvirus A23]SIP85811.1 Hypothetical protein PACV_94 [Pacmanvirus A23]